MLFFNIISGEKLEITCNLPIFPKLLFFYSSVRSVTILFEYMS